MATETAEVARMSPNFHPSVWGDTFESFVWDDQAAEKYAKDIEPLKEEVRAMLLAKPNTDEEKINLIDILERIGVSYHFDEEIEHLLKQCFALISNSEETNQYDLYHTALMFRIFRQHGFDISSGIFNKFKNSNGKFKEELSNNAKGLLSLYEATFLRRHGEDILEEALAFTKGHLKRMAPHLSSALGKQINHALEQSLQRDRARTKDYHNIYFYEEDETKNDKLLNFAKLDFNLLQMFHKQELRDVMRWWKPIKEKLSYVRDRVPECYFCALGVYFEPKYSLARIMTAKNIVLSTILDDTYDVYGTAEELKMLTDAVERWDIEEIDRLPGCIKIVYETLLNIYQEYDEELRKQGRSYAAENWRGRTKELVKAFYKETIWFKEGRIPDFEEYLENSLITSTGFLLMSNSLFFIESATREVLDWLKGSPKILIALATLIRCLDDMATYKAEKARGQLTTGIDCYMKQYDLSKEEAIAKFHEMAEDAWKDMNGEIRRTSSIPMDVFKRATNFSCLADLMFEYDQDHYTETIKVVKPNIISVLVDPLSI